MKKSIFLLTLSALFLVGCSPEEVSTFDSSNESLDQEVALRSSKGIIHHASVGSNDACAAFGLPNGCDKNFSLVANMKSDGSVSGQWQDGFGGDQGSIHVAIDCLNVIGNAAVVSGIVTKGTLGGVDITGYRAYTALVDNGNSKKDPADQISFSYTFVNSIGDCTGFIATNFELLNLSAGQVKVW